MRILLLYFLALRFLMNNKKLSFLKYFLKKQAHKQRPNIVKNVASKKTVGPLEIGSLAKKWNVWNFQKTSWYIMIMIIRILFWTFIDPEDGVSRCVCVENKQYFYFNVDGIGGCEKRCSAQNLDKCKFYDKVWLYYNINDIKFKIRKIVGFFSSLEI